MFFYLWRTACYCARSKFFVPLKSFFMTSCSIWPCIFREFIKSTCIGRCMSYLTLLNWRVWYLLQRVFCFVREIPGLFLGCRLFCICNCRLRKLVTIQVYKLRPIVNRCFTLSLHTCPSGFEIWLLLLVQKAACHFLQILSTLWI